MDFFDLRHNEPFHIGNFSSRVNRATQNGRVEPSPTQEQPDLCKFVGLTTEQADTIEQIAKTLEIKLTRDGDTLYFSREAFKGKTGDFFAQITPQQGVPLSSWRHTGWDTDGNHHSADVGVSERHRSYEEVLRQQQQQQQQDGQGERER